MDKVSVKEYAAVINRSESTVYRMIKKGTLEAKKGKKGFEILIDLSQLKCYTKQCKEMKKLKAQVKELKAQIASVAKAVPKKKIAKKTVKKAAPKKATVKKVVKKAAPKKKK